MKSLAGYLLTVFGLACLLSGAHGQDDSAKPKQPAASLQEQIEAAHTTYFQALQSNRIGRMPEEERLLLFLASLSDRQWKMLCSLEGLGLADVSVQQAPLYLSFLPDPFHTRASVLRTAGRHVFGPASTLTVEQRRNVRLYLRRAVVLTLIEAGSPTSGRVFHNLGQEGEQAIVVQDYTPRSKDKKLTPRLTAPQQVALQDLVSERAAWHARYGAQEPFLPEPDLGKRLEAAWQKAPGPQTVEVSVCDLTQAQQERINERVGAWNEQHPQTPVRGDRTRLYMELRLDYVLPNGVRAITPGT